MIRLISFLINLLFRLPAFVLICSTLLLSCTHGDKKFEKPVVTVSILPQKYFLEKLCGDALNIQVMIPPGESPATYDPSPRQMVALNESDIYFLTGQLVFENSWIREIIPQYEGTEFWDTSIGIEHIKAETSHGDHVHGTVDPHIWMSPENAGIMCQNMAKKLQKTYPDLSNLLDKNLKDLLDELESLDSMISNELAGISQRKFIIYHPALTYFARDYELTQISIEQDGKEPSSRYMKEVIDKAREYNIRVIFIQRQFNQQEANTVKNEIKGQVVVIDPLEYHWKEQLELIARTLKSQKLHHE